jgi:anti-anti-sigma factor
MITSTEIQADTATLRLHGQVIFSDCQRLSQVANNLMASPELKHLCIDLGEVPYVDSSGMGMLLVIRTHAARKQLHLTVAHPTTAVERTFKTFQFDRLFEIAH